jgi:signal peptide peptidase SppA
VTALDSLFARQPWLITTEAMQAMATQAVAFFDTRLNLPERESNPLLSVENGIASVRVRGPLMRQPDLFSVLLFGATDMDQVSAAISEAVEREDVDALLLDIDSPGGTVNGTPELGQTVADAAKRKTVYAFSAGQMSSAAYWIASQADAIYATPSARVGSIGVILPFVDSTEKLRNQGIKVEVFAAGKFKAMGTPGVSLTEEQRELIQSDIEEIAADFKAAVLVRGRRIPDEAMEGQTFSARKAQRFNLAGTVKSRDEVLARLRSLDGGRVDTSSRASMKTVEDQLTEALARIQSLEADAKAHQGLMSEASSQVESFKASLAQREQEHQAALQKAHSDRDTFNGQLIAVQAEVERFTKRATELETQVRDLQSREQDLDKRAATKAAQIAAEMGTQVPAKVTPNGDTQPATAAEVWNRQFTKA